MLIETSKCAWDHKMTKILRGKMRTKIYWHWFFRGTLNYTMMQALHCASKALLLISLLVQLGLRYTVDAIFYSVIVPSRNPIVLT